MNDLEFEELMKEAYPMVRGMSFKFNHRSDNTAAEDNIQNTMLMAWKYRDAFKRGDTKGKFFSWIATICKNEWFKRNRSLKARKEKSHRSLEIPKGMYGYGSANDGDDVVYWNPPDPASSQEDQYIAKELIDKIFPKAYQQTDTFKTLKYYVVDGWGDHQHDVRELAKRLGIKTVSMKHRRKRALKYARKQLARLNSGRQVDTSIHGNATYEARSL